MRFKSKSGLIKKATKRIKELMEGAIIIQNKLN